MSLTAMKAEAAITTIAASALAVFGIFAEDPRFVMAAAVILTGALIHLGLCFYLREEARVSEYYEEVLDDSQTGNEQQ